MNSQGASHTPAKVESKLTPKVKIGDTITQITAEEYLNINKEHKSLAPADAENWVYYALQTSPQWEIRGNINGGFSLAAAVRVCLTISPDHPHPLSTTSRYVAPLHVGMPATIRARKLSCTKSLSTLEAVVSSPITDAIYIHTTCTDLAFGSGEFRSDLFPPKILPAEECVKLEFMAGGIRDSLQTLFTPQSQFWDAEKRSGKGVLEGWIFSGELDNPDPLDSVSLLCITDAVPPASFGWEGIRGWVPTLELTVHIRNDQVYDKLSFHSQSTHLTNGYVEEDVTLWSGDTLMSMSRQIMRLPSRDKPIPELDA